MGMTDCNELKDAAYVASLLECSSAGARATDTHLVTSLREFDAPLQHLRTRGVTSGAEIQALRKAESLRTLRTGPPNTGGALNPLDINDAARRRQGLTNATCRGSCAWLAANSSIFMNQL